MNSGTSPDDGMTQAAEARSERRSVGDPVVQKMVFAVLVLVVLLLSVVVGVLVTGVTAPTGPRSVAEREMLIASASTKGRTGAGLAPYINALIAAGDYPAARMTLSQARGSVSATAPVSALDLAEARLLDNEKEYTKAASFADKAMKGYKAEYDARVAKGGATATAARAAGYGDDYYNAVLVKGYALMELRRWRDAVEAFDVYIRERPTSADILVDRGKAKLELKDEEGAEKDFKVALKYVPYDEDAKAGLQRIGAPQ